MSLDETGEPRVDADAADAAGVATLARRVAAARLPLGVAAGVLGLTALAGALSPATGLVAFLAIAAAIIAATPAGRTARARATPSPPDAAVDPAAPEAFLAALPSPLIVLGPDLAVRAFNDSALDLVPNLRRGEPLAFALRVPEIIDAARAVAEDGTARAADYAERVPIERFVEARLAPVEARGRVASILLMLRDVTQQKRIEAMRVDFVANASHELRTPLASILGFIETLQGPARNDPAARDRFLEIMRTQATRMSRLIDDLLSLSRIELNQHLRPSEPVDLASVLAQVVDTLKPLALERGVEVRLEADDGRSIVRGDRDELIRVFENLVENAVKYGAAGKRVDVRLVLSESRDGRPAEAVASVRDYGPGIAPEHQPRLTERFYRIDAEHARDKAGTGLGLAIVKHIVTRHRGRLAIESKPGEGATFTVRLDAEP